MVELVNKFLLIILLNDYSWEIIKKKKNEKNHFVVIQAWRHYICKVPHKRQKNKIKIKFSTKTASVDQNALWNCYLI